MKKNGQNGVHADAEYAFGTAENGLGSSKESAVHTFIRVLPTLFKGISAASAVVSLLRRLNRDEGSAWFGLAPRKSPFRTLGFLGVGVAVGVGVGMLFAPMTGAALRRTILRGDKNL